ncbi:hypothetical protein DF186_17325, partial [Enterococcus hirae]
HQARQDLYTRSGLVNGYALIHYEQLVKKRGVKLEENLNSENLPGWYAKHSIPAAFNRNAYLESIYPAFVSLSDTDPRHDWVIHASLSQ